MFDISWSEMAIIALLALVVIGPKDLPRVLRTMGQFMRKARALSREFQSGLNDVMREAELEEARKAIESTRSGQLDREIRKALDPDGSVDKELRDLDKEARAATSTPPAAPAKRHPEPGQGSDAVKDAKVVKHPAGKTAPAPSAATEAAVQEREAEVAESPEAGGGDRAQKTG